MGGSCPDPSRTLAPPPSRFSIRPGPLGPAGTISPAWAFRFGASCSSSRGGFSVGRLPLRKASPPSGPPAMTDHGGVAMRALCAGLIGLWCGLGAAREWARREGRRPRGPRRQQRSGPLGRRDLRKRRRARGLRRRRGLRLWAGGDLAELVVAGVARSLPHPTPLLHDPPPRRRSSASWTCPRR